MTVGELKKELEGLDDNLLVVLQKDSEGNGYDTAYQVDTNTVFDEDDREVYPKTITPEMEKQGWSEEDLGEGVDCVVIAP